MNESNLLNGKSTVIMMAGERWNNSDLDFQDTAALSAIFLSLYTALYTFSQKVHLLIWKRDDCKLGS